MSDFSDDEDRRLVQLAWALSQNGRRQIVWETLWPLWQQTKGFKMSKKKLQQRLKTLKRTYGPDLDKFPKRFKVKFVIPRPRPLSRPALASKRAKRVQEDGSPEKTPTKTENSSSFKMSPPVSKRASAMKIDPFSSLKLLAFVATDDGDDRSCV